MHRRIGPPTAARPAPGGPERPTHKCIKTVHFHGQVGRGHNCARGGGRAILCGRGAAPRMPVWRVRRSTTASLLGCKGRTPGDRGRPLALGRKSTLTRRSRMAEFQNVSVIRLVLCRLACIRLSPVSRDATGLSQEEMLGSAQAYLPAYHVFLAPIVFQVLPVNPGTKSQGDRP